MTYYLNDILINKSRDPQKIIVRIFLKTIFCIGLIFLNTQALASMLTIEPAYFSVLPTSILKGQTATAYYLVKNNTTSYQKNISVLHLPPNVEQIVSGSTYHQTCGKVFDLEAKGVQQKNPSAPHNSCYLQLKISGAVDSNDPNPKNHLTLCQGGSDCSKIDLKENELNIIEGIANNLARLSILLEHTETNDDTINNVTYSSDDGGIGWKRNTIIGASGYIRSVFCDKNGSLFCIAIGDSYNKGTNGYTTTFSAYTSNNGGKSWTKHILGVHGPNSGLNDVTCHGINGEYCLAVGAYNPSNNPKIAPIVYTSSDKGANWTPHFPKSVDSSLGTNITAVSCNGNIGQYCTAVGSFYSGYENNSNTTTFISYTSTDGGNNWVPHLMDKHAGISKLKSIKCNDNDGLNCIAVGHLNEGKKPIIYKSTNGGVDWNYTIPTEEVASTINSISCDNNNQFCKAVGHYFPGNNNLSFPIIYISKDGGLSWITKIFTNIANSTLESISCSNEGKYCTAIGTIYSSKKHTPIVYYSFDEGNSWIGRSASGLSNSGDTVRNIESTGIHISTNAQ